MGGEIADFRAIQTLFQRLSRRHVKRRRLTTPFISTAVTDRNQKGKMS
jgi:hypothetical protein